jgi:glycerol-3-phosphate dehydrogenase
MAEFDLAVIGGGINGTAIARDAAGRGLKVLLVEQGDLAGGTSSASTKLIHGGLRYLERREFRLVREALFEREVMLKTAPHLVRPMRFVLPPQDSGRSPFLIRAGLFLYDHLGGRRLLPRTRTVDLTHHACGVPLRRKFTFGFTYSDCRVDDARLVVANARDAADRGASIRPRTRCMRAERGEAWTLVLNAHGRRHLATARVLVNATGPWVAQVAEMVLRLPSPVRLRLVKGSHIVVPSLFDHASGYILPTRDGRVVFALPFENAFTLIGTTDHDFHGDLASPAPTAEEIGYLCATANGYFRREIGIDDVVWAFSGVRALLDDGVSRSHDLSRDYLLTLERPRRLAPLLTVYGGKLTVARRLAEAAMGRLAHYFAGQAPWTARVPLPGGDFPHDGFDALVEQTRRRWPFLSEEHARRLVAAYGTRVQRIVNDASSLDDLGERFGADLTAAELRYLMREEWAETADDVLWRRSKLGLRFSAAEREALARFMADSVGAPGAR